MPQYSTSTPQSVIRQETEPLAADYILWVKSSTNETFFSNGTSWTEIQTNTGILLTPIIENSLSILEIQAADTLTAGISANINNDVFSDSGGYLNRIDTGNTTAIFSTDKYSNYLTESHGQALSNDTGASGYQGFKIHTTAATSLVKITKSTYSNATTGYLLNSAKEIIDSQSFVGDVAIFSQALTDNTDYYVAVNGANFTKNTSITFPISGTKINWTGGLTDGSDSGTQGRSIVSINVDAPTDKIIQTNEQTLASTPTYFQIFAYKDSTTGTGTITADISFDSGANYQTGIALDTITQITDTGTGMILKLNLNAGASNGTAECKGYGVLYW